MRRLSRGVDVELSVVAIAFIAYGNLRGVKESGRMFAVPTYFFILNMVVLLGLGLFKLFFGHLPVDSLYHAGLVKRGRSQPHFLAPFFGRCVHISQDVAGD